MSTRQAPTQAVPSLSAGVRSAWFPVARSRDVRRRPLRVQLWGTPIALFRGDDGQLAALLDRCPHRGAPLSDGRLKDGCLACPYHGWAFDQHGVCQRVPGLVGAPPPAARVKALSVTERAGLVFVRPGSREGAPPLALPEATEGKAAGFDVALYSLPVRGPLGDHLENFLDGAHTHFVHEGIIRRDDGRQRITATRQASGGVVEVRYDGEGKQNGWVSRLFEAERDVSFGRYRFPACAEVEYRSRKETTYVQVNWFTPHDERGEELTLFAAVCTPRGLVPGWLKRWSMWPVFYKVMDQDRCIVASTADNLALFGGTAVVDTEIDLFGPAIRRALSAGEPAPDDDENVVEFDL